MDLAEAIRDLREAEELSQAAFGERIGYSGGAVSRLETRTSVPQPTAIHLINKEFGVNLAILRKRAAGLAGVAQEEEPDIPAPEEPEEPEEQVEPEETEEAASPPVEVPESSGGQEMKGTSVFAVPPGRVFTHYVQLQPTPYPLWVWGLSAFAIGLATAALIIALR